MVSERGLVAVALRRYPPTGTLAGEEPHGDLRFWRVLWFWQKAEHPPACDVSLPQSQPRAFQRFVESRPGSGCLFVVLLVGKPVPTFPEAL